MEPLRPLVCIKGVGIRSRQLNAWVIWRNGTQFAALLCAALMIAEMNLCG